MRLNVVLRYVGLILLLDAAFMLLSVVDIETVGLL